MAYLGGLEAPVSNASRGSPRILGIVSAVVLVFQLSGCQNYRDAFNPIQILCPGDFDPVSNACVVKTGETREE